jgi:hypothetical protein
MPSSQPSGPAAWTAILDNIEQTLTRSLDRVAEREAEARSDQSPTLPDITLSEAVTACDLRLGGLRSHVGRAEADAAEADAALLASEKALQYWLEALAAVRQRLADGQADPV